MDPHDRFDKNFFIHPTRGGQPSRIWVYRNAAGEAQTVRALYNGSGPAETLSWEWRETHYQSSTVMPNVLYGLERLSAAPGKRVLLTDSPEDADRAQEMWPERGACLAVTGGWKSTDYTPIKDKVVLIWCESTPVGDLAANEIARAVQDSAKSVTLIKMPMPEGWSLAQARDEERDSLRALAKKHTTVWPHFKLKEAPVTARGEVMPTEHTIQPAADSPGAAHPANNTRTIDWASLAGEPPPRVWWIQDWLGPSPTLTAGAGGVGKTLLWQTIATALATGHAFLGPQAQPLRVLMWQCEETLDDIWRRQAAINSHFELAMTDLGRLHVCPRQGLDNTLMALNFGQPVFSPLLAALAEQVNDLKIDVLVLDNLAQLYGGNENDRHQATYFVNGIAGLVRDRPFCPVLLGHVAKSTGSEFSGAMAWENAVRMRWYVGSKLPDLVSHDEEDEREPDVIYLARRKVNYGTKDFRKLRYHEGVFAPEEVPDGVRFDQAFRDAAAEDLVMAGLKKLQGMGLTPSDGKGSPDYLPSQMVAKRIHAGHTRKELSGAMNRLMSQGRLRRDIVGKYSNRNPRYGLVAP